MKIPYCSKCGKKLKGLVPDDAICIICFACDNLQRRAQRKED